MYEDTIAALSTPPGEGGIGIVRLSGKRSLEIIEKIFKGKIRNRRLSYGKIIDTDSGEPLDEVLVSFMPAPHTYTREDIAEINCHSGPLVLRLVLELVLRNGARLALPGEFTLRAFLNGRIDLSQAEAVLDIVKSKTDNSLKIAFSSLGGNLSREIEGLRRRIMEALAYITAKIDFPEDDIEERAILPSLEKAHTKISSLISNADAGIIYREGLKTAIVGRPNVGKSSLLNRLLKCDRAIVTPLPGTTRDLLEETINIRGLPLVLMDTAGITSSHDLIESLGIERTYRAISKADLILWVIDMSEPLKSEDHDIKALVDGKKVLVAANKIDLPRQANLSEIKWKCAYLSALTGEGMEELEEMILNISPGINLSEKAIVSHARHKDALIKAQEALCRSLNGFKNGIPEDCLALDLTESLEALGEITGNTLREDLLETIFSNFCIGK